MVLLFGIITLCGGLNAFAEETLFDSCYETAKEQCHDIHCIRAQINRINEEILKLLAERTAYVQRAGDLKSKTTRVAEDRLRVSQQEQILREKSLELGVPVEISIEAFKVIVENSTKFQQKYIDNQ